MDAVLHTEDHYQPEDHYQRGRTDGQVLARLEHHDKQLADIKGAVEALGAEMHTISKAVQGLAKTEEAREQVRIETAAALKDHDDSRRKTQEDRWLPWVKLFTFIMAVSAVASIAASIFDMLKP